jgi:hypothetical protein
VHGGDVSAQVVDPVGVGYRAVDDPVVERRTVLGDHERKARVALVQVEEQFFEPGRFRVGLGRDFSGGRRSELDIRRLDQLDVRVAVACQLSHRERDCSRARFVCRQGDDVEGRVEVVGVERGAGRDHREIFGYPDATLAEDLQHHRLRRLITVKDQRRHGGEGRGDAIECGDHAGGVLVRRRKRRTDPQLRRGRGGKFEPRL